MTTPIVSLSIAARMTLNLHSLNNEGGEGNQIQTRMIDIVSEDQQLHNVNAISGDMLKHVLMEHFLGWQTESERARIRKENVLKPHQGGGEEWQERRPALRRPNRSHSNPCRPHAEPVAARCGWGITVTAP
jgi:hypothetical protein